MTQAEFCIPGYDPFATTNGYAYDEWHADRACDFFAECLTHTKGELAGGPFSLEAWEESIVRAIFGFVHEGFRRYREVFIYLPRKNGKSTLAAGLALTVMCLDDEPGAELYSAAAEGNQARFVFDTAKEMVRQDEELSARLKIYQHSISFPAAGSSYKPISAETYSKHGMNLHLAVVDELHAVRDPEFIEVLESSTSARRQPLIVYITTADYARESVCNEKLAYARQVRDGLIEDPAFLPVIYAADDEDDWRDEAVWKKTNPNLGVSIRTEEFRREFEKATTNPRKEHAFRRLRLNQTTRQETKWLDLDLWDQCGGRPDEPPDGAVAFCGLDLAATTDIAAFVMFFPEHAGRVIARFWCPAEHPEAPQKYAPWIRSGALTTTPGSVIDYEFIRNEIKRWSTRYRLDIGADPWNARQLLIQLEQDGIQVVEFRQGFVSMSEPTKRVEMMVLEKKFVHDGNAVLRWMISNAMVVTDAAENVKVHRAKSPDKVDGAVALVMAVGRWLADDSPGPSIYETRGLTIL